MKKEARKPGRPARKPRGRRGKRGRGTRAAVPLPSPRSRHLIGVDEVGRGPIAGPVTVCAFAVGRSFDLSALSGIKDSKQLSRQKREEWLKKLSMFKERGELDFAVASTSAEEIDAIGISAAIAKALRKALQALEGSRAPIGGEPLAAERSEVFLDGLLRAPEHFALQHTIVKGDERVPLISAASIVAKVMRDRFMEEAALVYPGYGFAEHKGYGTKTHYAALMERGVCELHRLSFLKKFRG